MDKKTQIYGENINEKLKESRSSFVAGFAGGLDTFGFLAHCVKRNKKETYR